MKPERLSYFIVDVVADTTVTSRVIMAAVEDALSKTR
jgi:uncharacterized protein with FMN-binding domain